MKFFRIAVSIFCSTALALRADVDAEAADHAQSEIPWQTDPIPWHWTSPVSTLDISRAFSPIDGWEFQHECQHGTHYLDIYMQLLVHGNPHPIKTVLFWDNGEHGDKFWDNREKIDKFTKKLVPFQKVWENTHRRQN